MKIPCFKSNSRKILQNPEIQRLKEIKGLNEVIESQRQEIEECKRQIDDYAMKDLYVRSLIHDLININRGLKYDTDDLDFEEMSPEEKNLWSQSNLLSIVMNTYGFQYNQEVSDSASKRLIPIYKKADKLRRCYRYSRGADFNIVITGNSTLAFSSTNIIEVLFYILIENARKYTLKGEGLRIHFEEGVDDITVTFTNKCELPSKEDMQHLTEMNYRGVNKSKDGNGIGLATFAAICRSNGIRYVISRDHQYTNVDKTPVGYFSVKLYFQDCRPLRRY